MVAKIIPPLPVSKTLARPPRIRPIRRVRPIPASVGATPQPHSPAQSHTRSVGRWNLGLGNEPGGIRTDGRPPLAKILPRKMSSMQTNLKKIEPVAAEAGATCPNPGVPSSRLRKRLSTIHSPNYQLSDPFSLSFKHWASQPPFPLNQSPPTKWYVFVRIYSKTVRTFQPASFLAKIDNQFYTVLLTLLLYGTKQNNPH